jgi:hypothetical protein
MKIEFYPKNLKDIFKGLLKMAFIITQVVEVDHHHSSSSIDSN